MFHNFICFEIPNHKMSFIIKVQIKLCDGRESVSPVFTESSWIAKVNWTNFWCKFDCFQQERSFKKFCN